MLNEIGESKRQNPVAASQVVRDGAFIEEMLAQLDSLDVPFSGEECMGRYLDLHRVYNKYVNSEFGCRLDYDDYLAKFPAVDDDMISSRMKCKKEYQEYIAEILEYLVSFVERAHPLMFLDREWAEKNDMGTKRPRVGVTELWDSFEIEQYNTVEGLMEAGPEKLKEVLDTLGLKSGGTVQQKAERVLLAKNSALEKMDRKHFRKEKDGRRVKETALMEAKVKKLCELLKETLDRTIEHVKIRQTMTRNEVNDYIAEHENSGPNDVDDDEKDDVDVYNPLKLPLGFDGRPIPYWLYKLHGLGQKFDCEICGNYTYSGRREFEMHFKEWRHQHGMQCLGIPNTKSFHEITSIDAARKLWEEIEERPKSRMWQPDLYEEFEDADGNVYDKKTYTDLTRQGLI
ncbi:hypothetical protein RND81_13G142200 [Saponaria officinalis]|uniref:Matrin-type domain-containing protein n=1 Tax=Saponaria officinalis TaxID=3572 RepID=A0AAW1H391_SAPOF